MHVDMVKQVTSMLHPTSGISQICQGYGEEEKCTQHTRGVLSPSETNNTYK